jgi:membrane fusion protein, multidrug efflux system
LLAFSHGSSSVPKKGVSATSLSLGAILLLAIGGLGCGTAASTPTASGGSGRGRGGRGGGQANPVAVAVVQRQDVPVYLTGLGSVTAFNTVGVKSRVDGQLVQVAFQEGQMVNKGDLLAVIDPRSYEIQLSQAQAAQTKDQAALSRDQAQLRDVKLNLSRFEDLVSQGVISSQQRDSQSALVDEVAGAIRSDEAAINVDQALIDNAKLQITYCHITAPVSGRVGLRMVDEGNIVRAADPNPMLVITQVQPIAVLFTLPADDLPAVLRQMSQGTLEVDAYSRDDQRKLGTGKLLTLDNTIDQTTGTIRLKAQFDNRDDALWPNQFVNVQLLLEVRKNSIVVPAATIQRGPQGTFIFVVKEDNTVDVRPVSISLTQGLLAVVDQGVSEGETVVTDGQDKLQANSKVEVRNGGASADGSAKPGPSGDGSGKRKKRS